MKHIILTISLSVFCIALFGQIIPKKDYVPEIRKSRYSFAVSLIANQISLVTYGILVQAPDSSKRFKYLSKSSFLRQITAHEKSRANPDTINYFDVNKIHFQIIDEIWKLKYSEYPFDGSKEKGWGTTKGKPSNGQFAMLKKFGITKISDYCYGDSLISLLKSLDDPMWVQQYQNSK